MKISFSISNAHFHSTNTPSSSTDSTQTPPLRIADILSSTEDEDSGERQEMSGGRCYLRRIGARWLSVLKRVFGESRNREGESQCLGGGVEFYRGDRGGDSVSRIEENSGRSGPATRETSLFNVAVAFVLLHVIAQSKNELGKMSQMRMQMEKFLREAKEERMEETAATKPSKGNNAFVCPRADSPQAASTEAQYFPLANSSLYALTGSSKSTVCYETPKRDVHNDLDFEDQPSFLTYPSSNVITDSSTTTDCNDSQNTYPPVDPNFQIQLSPLSNALPDSSTTALCNDSPECEESMQKEVLKGMDQLEAELEAELELLQLRLDTHIVMEHSQQSAKVNVGDTVLRNRILSHPEIFLPSEARMEYCGGISPRELERRLQEVLEVRQEERIEELETALESLKQKLSEKELEVSWWKDAVMRISQNLSEPSVLSTQHDEEGH